MKNSIHAAFASMMVMLVTPSVTAQEMFSRITKEEASSFLAIIRLGQERDTLEARVLQLIAEEEDPNATAQISGLTPEEA